MKSKYGEVDTTMIIELQSPIVLSKTKPLMCGAYLFQTVEQFLEWAEIIGAQFLPQATFNYPSYSYILIQGQQIVDGQGLINILGPKLVDSDKYDEIMFLHPCPIRLTAMCWVNGFSFSLSSAAKQLEVWNLSQFIAAINLANHDSAHCQGLSHGLIPNMIFDSGILLSLPISVKHDLQVFHW